MAEFLVRRALISIVTLVIISLIVFAGVRAIPGDPARVLAGAEADAAGLEEIREKYGLNDPLAVQYLRWVGHAIRGDLGVSIRTRQPVAATVATKLPITLQLASFSILVALAIAIPAGVLAAVKRNTAWDVLMSGLSLGGYVPPWQDPVDNLRRMLMPALVLGTGLAAVLMRQTRNAMIEVLSADYIRTARAKGLAQPAVVVRHALRNSLVPVVTILGLQMGALMSGAVVTEQIFVVPGFGRLVVEAVFTRDYPLVQGVVLITASSYVLINLLVDVSYSVLNPRIRIRGADGS